MLVKDLISFLKQFPDNAVVFSSGPDSGGYDAVFGVVTTVGTIGKIFMDEFDLTLKEFKKEMEGVDPLSPCIFHSQNH